MNRTQPVDSLPDSSFFLTEFTANRNSISNLAIFYTDGLPCSRHFASHISVTIPCSEHYVSHISLARPCSRHVASHISYKYLAAGILQATYLMQGKADTDLQATFQYFQLKNYTLIY